MTPPRAHSIAAVLLALAALAGCGGGSGQALKQRASSSAREQTSGPAPTIAGAVPPQLDPLNVYAAAGAGALVGGAAAGLVGSAGAAGFGAAVGEAVVPQAARIAWTVGGTWVPWKACASR